jgi:glycosyltransferase involved in cell wall biosynthesis
VVAERDRQALRLVAQPPQVEIIANGVDTEHFCPQRVPVAPASCVFWGRLDFGPNQQALEWFLTHVWPLVQAEVPGATCGVYGFHPPERIRQLTARAGVTLTADRPDLRAAVSQHAVAVLPFVSGGGVKNKLLEAAGLGLPIVASPTAFGGLRGKHIPILKAAAPRDWATALVRLWRDDAERQRLGQAARAWVCAWHSWDRSAAEAQQSVRSARQVA